MSGNSEVEYKVTHSPLISRHLAILRSWRLPLLRRGIISLSLLSSAHSYDYYFKLDTYTPVSFVLDALHTTVVFKIERRERFWSGAQIPSKSTKERHRHTAKSYRLYCRLCLRAYLRDKRQLKSNDKTRIACPARNLQA